MTDWKCLGRRAELRKEILKTRVVEAKHRLKMFRLTCELRVLLWYDDKKRKLRLLAESERFRQRDGDGG